jgi:hypothetical protein
MTTRKAADAAPADVLPLPAELFQILVALAGRERHGYGIMQDIAARTGDKMRLSPASARSHRRNAGHNSQAVR